MSPRKKKTETPKKPEQDVGLGSEPKVTAEPAVITPEAKPEPEPESAIKATETDWNAMANMHAAQYLKFGDNPPTDESTQNHIKAAKRYEAICLSQIKK